MMIAAALVASLLLNVGLVVILKRGSPAAAMYSVLHQSSQEHERIERVVRDESERGSEQRQRVARGLRDELAERMGEAQSALVSGVTKLGGAQREQLQGFSEQLHRLLEHNDKRLSELRVSLERHLRLLQEDNGKKLDEMRRTVDEKLQGTLEKRLGESFRVVSDQLERVHKGLGEMQSLAVGVGDLKRVLANVKTRGTWGEVLLENLLEQLLAPEQYDRQVTLRPGTRERVDFAIRMPGQGSGDGGLWLPIDAKFPKEDYERLMEASERGDQDEVERAGKELEVRVRTCAKEVSEKYVLPPITTDFGILFLASEGLYAEVLRRPGLVEVLQRDYRMTLAGPTTLAALLNSLQLGFRTLAIQQRSSEVWALLGAVKTEFGRFGSVLASVQKKLGEASSHIDKASVRTRAIEKRLKDVEELPGIEARALIGNDDDASGPALVSSG